MQKSSRIAAYLDVVTAQIAIDLDEIRRGPAGWEATEVPLAAQRGKLIGEPSQGQFRVEPRGRGRT